MGETTPIETLYSQSTTVTIEGTLATQILANAASSPTGTILLVAGLVPLSDSAGSTLSYETLSTLTPIISRTSPTSSAATATSSTPSLGNTYCTSAQAQVPTHSSCPRNERLTGGAVAGVGIATAVLGALIAAIAVFFLMKKRQRKHRHRDTVSHSDSGVTQSVLTHTSGEYDYREKNGASTDVSLILPQPLDDKTVEAEVEKFFRFVEGHVDSGYYHDEPSEANAMGEQAGVRLTPLPLGISSQSGIHYEELLATPSSRRSAIISLVCAEALAAIDIRGETQRSLLPAMVTSFTSATDIHAQKSPASRLSLSRWRTSTSFLLGTPNNATEKARQDRVIELLIQDLDEVLGRFSSTQQKQQRNTDLVSIFKRAQKLGLLLFSQPAEWVFEWRWNSSSKKQNRQGADTSLVVLPGLLKVTDNSATAFNGPRIVLKPKTFG